MDYRCGKVSPSDANKIENMSKSLKKYSRMTIAKPWKPHN